MVQHQNILEDSNLFIDSQTKAEVARWEKGSVIEAHRKEEAE